MTWSHNMHKLKTWLLLLVLLVRFGGRTTSIGCISIITWIGTIRTSEEPFIRRVYSHSGKSRRSVAFRNSVLNRDRKCVLSGISNPRAQFDSWQGFDTAHVFPKCGLSRYITATTAHIYSVQNGLLMTASIHQCFDGYELSVNPDVSQFTS